MKTTANEVKSTANEEKATTNKEKSAANKMKTAANEVKSAANEVKSTEKEMKSAANDLFFVKLLHQTTDSYDSMGGQTQNKFRSPWVLLTRPTVGQNFDSRTQGRGKTAFSRG